MAIAAISAYPPSAPSPASSYSVTEIAIPRTMLPWPNSNSLVAGLNARGDVVANGSNSGQAYLTRGFLWRNGAPRDVGSLPDAKCAEVSAVNAKGQVVGWSYENPGQPYHQRAFLWADGKMRDLGALGGLGSSARAVNDAGQVVGDADTATKPYEDHQPPPYHAFLWQNGKMHDLGAPQGGFSEAYAINNRGQIAGASYISKVINSKMKGFGYEVRGGAVVWQNGKEVNLGSLGGGSSRAYGINDKGQVVGMAHTSVAEMRGEAPYHAVLWENGKITDLGTLGGRNSVALAINNRGQVVGWSDPAKPRSPNSWAVSPSAFIWDREHGMRDLNDLLAAPDASWYVIKAKGINDAGQIAAEGLPSKDLPNGSFRPALLTPR